jgi:hypothetical protein
VVTVVEARYREETDFEFLTVTILPDGVSVRFGDVHRQTTPPVRGHLPVLDPPNRKGAEKA